MVLAAAGDVPTTEAVAAASDVDAVRSAFGPRLRAEGSYGMHDSEFWPEDKEWSAGLAVELPVFTGFSRQHALARTRDELARQEAEVRQLVLSVRQEVWSAW